MLSSNMFRSFRGDRVLRGYRASLGQALRQEPAFQRMPTLLDLPLGAGLPDLAALLAPGAAFAIQGPIGSGRSLFLRQIAARWAESNAPTPLLYLPLAALDVPTMPPRTCLSAALYATRLPSPLEGAQARGGHDRPWLLLVDEWEELSLERRADWRAFFSRLPESWPSLRLAVALPPTITWAGLEAVQLPTPDDELVATWLRHLLGAEPPAPLLDALAADGPLHHLRDRLADLALLALTYVSAGLPASRAALYQRMHALGEPSGPAASEHEPRAPTTTSFAVGAGVWHAARLADRLSATPTEALALAEPVRGEVVRHLAGLCANPDPLYTALAATNDPACHVVLLEAVADRPEAAPGWTQRLLEAEPMLLDPAALLRVVDAASLPCELRWAAAEQVARAAPTHALAPTSAQLDQIAQAARAYILASGGPTTRMWLAEPTLRPWLNELFAASYDTTHRAVAASALLADEQLPSELRARALAAQPQLDAIGATALEQACVDGEATVRALALAALARRPAKEALSMLARLVARPTLNDEQRTDLVATLCALPQPAASLLLARCVLLPSWPLHARLAVLLRLAERHPSDTTLLHRILNASNLPPVLRAAAARLLGQTGDSAALPLLRGFALGEASPTLRRAAVAALGALGSQPANAERVLNELCSVLRQPTVEHQLVSEVAHALGRCRAVGAFGALAELIAADHSERFRSAWLAAERSCADLPPLRWPTLALAPSARLSLMDLLAAGATEADPPTTFGELVDAQAMAVRSAAAKALAECALNFPPLAQRASRLLTAALQRNSGAPLARAVFAALNRIGSPAGYAALDSLLVDPALGDKLPLLTLEPLAGPAAIELALRHLHADTVSGFVATQLVELIGRESAPAAVPVLRELLVRESAALYLRKGAATALGRMADPAAIAALLESGRSRHTPLALRVAAIDAIPPISDARISIVLADLLREPRQPTELAAALIHALGRLRDHASLPLLLRYAQSEDIREALAALTALIQVGDGEITPVLVHITQSATAPRSVRLAAVEALLQLGGAEHMPLLREYLDTPLLPLRLQAHAILASFDPADPRLIEPLAVPAAPLVLRLRAIEHLATINPGAAILPALLANPAEPLQLRVTTATVLGNARGTVTTLVTVATHPATPPVLAQRCITALVALAADATTTEAHAALGTLAADASLPIELRDWAAEALLVDAGIKDEG